MPLSRSVRGAVLLLALSAGCGSPGDHGGGDGGAPADAGTLPGDARVGDGALAGDGSAGGDGGAACKRGIAYGHHSMADLAALRPGISWWYNWALTPDSAVSTSYPGLGVEYVPMVWGQGSLATANRDIPSGARYLLAFNEPNFGSQSNLTPAAAAALWPQVEAVAHAHNLAIVSPALNYCGGTCNQTSPFAWFDAFFAACPGCQVDYLAVHWYACSKSALTGYINQMKKYNRPIWLTEFSCLDQTDTSVAVQKAYMAEALPYLESEPAVMRYSWFSGRFDQTPSIDLLAGSGQLTELGQQYVSAPGACP